MTRHMSDRQCEQRCGATATVYGIERKLLG